MIQSEKWLATGWESGVRYHLQDIYLCHHIQNGPYAHPRFYQWLPGSYTSGVEHPGCKAYRLPPATVDMKDGRSFIYTPLIHHNIVVLGHRF